MKSKKLLEVSELKTAFVTKGIRTQAVRNVSFFVEAGDTLGIVGESGSGKSVLMKTIMGILPENAEVQGTSIRFEHKELLTLPIKELQMLKGKEMAMIFQDPMTALNPLKKIGSQITEILTRHRGLKGQAARSQAVDLLQRVGIPSPQSRMNQYPHEFSGGMRQRVLIAMALACNPKLLIADEPTTALDVTIQAQILELLKELQSQSGLSIILITHDLGVVANTCNRILVMYGGMEMEEALTGQIFSAPKHPYTMALLNAIPKLDSDREERLEPIPGRAPSLIDPPKGCPFADRCKFAVERCRVEMPPLREINLTQKSRCFFNFDQNGKLTGEGI